MILKVNNIIYNLTVYNIFIYNFHIIKEAGIGDEAAKEGDTNLPTVSAADSDIEAGLVIDQEEKKKPMKRKTFSAAVIHFFLIYL